MVLHDNGDEHVAPTTVPISYPCALGLPEILTRAHLNPCGIGVGWRSRRSHHFAGLRPAGPPLGPRRRARSAVSEVARTSACRALKVQSTQIECI